MYVPLLLLLFRDDLRTSKGRKRCLRLKHDLHTYVQHAFLHCSNDYCCNLALNTRSMIAVAVLASETQRVVNNAKIRAEKFCPCWCLAEHLSAINHFVRRIVACSQPELSIIGYYVRTVDDTCTGCSVTKLFCSFELIRSHTRFASLHTKRPSAPWPRQEHTTKKIYICTYIGFSFIKKNATTQQCVCSSSSSSSESARRPRERNNPERCTSTTIHIQPAPHTQQGKHTHTHNYLPPMVLDTTASYIASSSNTAIVISFFSTSRSKTVRTHYTHAGRQTDDASLPPSHKKITLEVRTLPTSFMGCVARQVGSALSTTFTQSLTASKTRVCRKTERNNHSHLKHTGTYRIYATRVTRHRTSTSTRTGCCVTRTYVRAGSLVHFSAMGYIGGRPSAMG